MKSKRSAGKAIDLSQYITAVQASKAVEDGGYGLNLRTLRRWIKAKIVKSIFVRRGMAKLRYIEKASLSHAMSSKVAGSRVL